MRLYFEVFFISMTVVQMKSVTLSMILRPFLVAETYICLVLSQKYHSQKTYTVSFPNLNF